MVWVSVIWHKISVVKVVANCLVIQAKEWGCVYAKGSKGRKAYVQ